MKYRWLYFAVSLLVIGPGLISLLINGLRPAIDFTGGSLLEVEFVGSPKKEVTLENIQSDMSQLYEVSAVQISGDQEYVIRGKTIPNDQKNLALEVLQEEYAPVLEKRFETVGPTLGRELMVKTGVAILLAAGLIAAYVSYQFKESKYGVTAVLAMLHDSLILIGIFSLLGRSANVEVDVLFVTALLTTLSFSVHDTIVVFDRIREFRRLQPRLPYAESINGAVLQTLGRSLNNSMTIIIMLLALVVLGGESIRWFAVALLIGAITGTYSSTFTAAPLLLTWDEVATKIRHRKRK
jgi:preprotein translocase subunit SecF